MKDTVERLTPMLSLFSFFTYTVYSINERVIAAVAHCQPVKDKEHDVYIFPLVDCRVHNSS